MSEMLAALYMRLSREESLQDAEPDSIVSQRLFLMQYAQMHGIKVVAEYADSGVSGTKWERCGLQDLLRMIEDGRINTVLVKDLSRLSRDYLRTGTLLESWFPMHGVRLIAVNDGVDTGAHSSANDYSPIRAVMDDWYARDISRKVRAAIYARQTAGICTAASLPYGYIRCGGEISAEPEKAAYVADIFRSYAESRRLHIPADRLNAAGIPSPRCSESGWSTATIRRILLNPAYCGALHIHVTEKTSYKCPRRITIPESGQIIIPVPEIIPRTLFDAVQAILAEQAHTARHVHWLSGRVICGDCGSRCIISSGRLICGGKKRGNGCRCRSLPVDALLRQIADAVHADGFPADSALLSRLVRRILISDTQLTVFVTYRKPRLYQKADMYNITK